MAKHYHTLAPPDLLDAVDAHARALCGGDDRRAASFISERALQAHQEALARITTIRPLRGYEVIARARLGRHYIVKVRFHGEAANVTLQNRWHSDDSHQWRVVEVEDIDLRRPWVKPDKPTVTANA